MKRLDNIVKQLTMRTAQAAQVVLVFVTCLVVLNVITRIRWNPVPGTVELVEMSGAVMLALSIAYTAYRKGHIAVSILVEKFRPSVRRVIEIFVSAVALFFTSVLTVEIFRFGTRMLQRGYVTGHLQLPIAPAIYLVAFGFLMLALVLLRDLLMAVFLNIKGGGA
jgi:TRAP-type C4-dicarboxylate transport system permease small subunit